LPQRVLKEQPDKVLLQAEISALLERLVIIFQIQNWNEKNSIFLSEWIIENYKYDSFESVKKCLKNPPSTEDPNWRLTPDTIRLWMTIQLDKEAESREIEISKNKAKIIELPELIQPVSNETEAMINNYLESLTGPKEVQAMTDEDVKKYGQARPVKKGAESFGYVPNHNNALIIEKKLQAARSRGLDKLDFNEIKSFVVEGQTVVARNYEEAMEIYAEVYL